MDISKMSTIELEALGYRVSKDLRNLQQNLEIIEVELKRRQDEVAQELPKDEMKKPKSSEKI